MQTRIAAILSDFDGTLCPTDSVKSKAGTIPEELEQILWDISRQIPICIVSSKDYHFLHSKTRFAKILSCVMGIETISLKIHKEELEEINGEKIGSSNINNIKEECANISSYFGESYLLPNSHKRLQTNSGLLSRLAEDIESEFMHDVVVERKFTADRQFLVGITIDYRHLKDWRSYKNTLEPSLKEMIREYQLSSSVSIPDLYILNYSSHPFLDVYALYCNKGMAFEFVTSDILSMTSKVGGRVRSTLYLGDSENDNPAFKRADISIGISSDKRLNTELDCEYHIEYDYLSVFLKRLIENNFVFTENLIM
jgi:HAD superfamily hydrolase (TIGR01484 family)